MSGSCRQMGSSTEQNLIHAKDMWQLGMLFKSAAVGADVAITSYAGCLLAGGFATAALAQAS